MLLLETENRDTKWECFSIIWKKTDFDKAVRTVADEQQDEGFVPEEVDDGLFVGVVVGQSVREHGLGLTRGFSRTVFDHWGTQEQD